MSAVYVIGTVPGDPVKVGIADHVESRRSSLQTSHPLPLIVFGAVECDREVAKRLERLVHVELAKHRLKGEWFSVSPTIALEHVRALHPLAEAHVRDARAGLARSRTRAEEERRQRDQTKAEQDAWNRAFHYLISAAHGVLDETAQRMDEEGVAPLSAQVELTLIRALREIGYPHRAQVYKAVIQDDAA